MNNPSIQEQNFILKAQKNVIDDSYGYFMPKVDVTIERKDIRDSYKVNNGVDKSTSNRNNLTAIWNIFNGFNDYNNLKTEKYRYKSKVYEKKRVVEKLLLDFITNYAEYLKVKEIYDIANINLKSYKKYIRKMKLKKDYGMSSMSLTSKIEKKYNSILINYIEQNEKRYYDALYKLQQYIKISKKSDILLSYSDIDIELLGYSVDNITDKTVEKNANVLKAKADMLVEKKKLDKLYSKFLPIVDLKLTRDELTDDFVDNHREITNETTFVIQARMNIFNGVRDYTAIKQEMNNYKKAKAKFKNTIIEAKLKLKVAWNEYLTLKKKESIVTKNVINADKAYVSTEYDFEFAKTDEEGVITAMQSLQDAQTQSIKLKYDKAIAKYKILNAMGILFDTIKDRIQLDDKTKI